MRGFAVPNRLGIGATIAEIGLAATVQDIAQRFLPGGISQHEIAAALAPRIGATQGRTTQRAERRRRGSQGTRRSTARQPVSVAKLDKIEANTLLTLFTRSLLFRCSF